MFEPRENAPDEEAEEVESAEDTLSAEEIQEAQAPAAEALSDSELEAAAETSEKKADKKSSKKVEEPQIPFVMDAEPFASAVEAILFAAERPVGFERIRSAFGEPAPTDAQLKEIIEQIQTRYEAADRGFLLRKAQGGYHFVTKVENAEYIRRFQASKPFRLGRSALEVMAIIAYRQPITRAEIDQVRGIDSSHLLRTLIERGLVRMAGKAEIPGRPVQYGSTEKFLEVMGLASTMELPPLSELTQLQGDTEDPQKRMEDGLDRFMQPLDRSGEEELPPLEDENGLDPVLGAIDSMIQTADHAPKEIYASAIHREVAEANQEALEAFQSANRRRPRKAAEAKSITFDELTGAGVPPLSN
ncbi:SMC-Scp complex subunit ScpB [bacterium]|nr:SMC-Scp complex subunit ScpB [bacterium]